MSADEKIAELEQRLADLSAPLTVKCEKCGGEGWLVARAALAASPEEPK